MRDVNWQQRELLRQAQSNNEPGTTSYASFGDGSGVGYKITTPGLRYEEAAGVHNAYRVDVHDCEPSVTFEEAVAASKAVKCFPGKAVVACHRPRTKVGLLHLPEDMQDRFRADVATVIAVGEGVALTPGQVVVTDWQLGKRVQGFSCEGFETSAEVRFYGLCGGTAKDGDDGCEDLPFGAQDWHEGIVMIKDGEKLLPTGDKVLMRLPEMKEGTDSGILLADTARKRDALWPIVAVGPDADPCLVGKYALVHTSGCQYTVTDDGCEYAFGKTTGRDAPVYAVVG